MEILQTIPITFDIPVADVAVEFIIQGMQFPCASPVLNFTILCPLFSPLGDQTVGQIKDSLWSLIRFVNV